MAAKERQQERARLAQEARAKALQARMNDAAGRALVYDELAPMRRGLLRADSSNRIDDRATTFAIARHDDAVAYLDELEAVCPDLVVLMVSEAMERRKAQ